MGEVRCSDVVQRQFTHPNSGVEAARYCAVEDSFDSFLTGLV